MSRLYIAPDVRNNPTIWHRRDDRDARAVLTRGWANADAFDALAALIRDAQRRDDDRRLGGCEP